MPVIATKSTSSIRSPWIASKKGKSAHRWSTASVSAKDSAPRIRSEKICSPAKCSTSQFTHRSAACQRDIIRRQQTHAITSRIYATACSSTRSWYITFGATSWTLSARMRYQRGNSSASFGTRRLSLRRSSSMRCTSSVCSRRGERRFRLAPPFHSLSTKSSLPSLLWSLEWKTHFRWLNKLAVETSIRVRWVIVPHQQGKTRLLGSRQASNGLRWTHQAWDRPWPLSASIASTWRMSSLQTSSISTHTSSKRPKESRRSSRRDNSWTLQSIPFRRRMRWIPCSSLRLTGRQNRVLKFYSHTELTSRKPSK